MGWIWVIFDLWSDYSLSFLLKTLLYLLRVTCAARSTSFRSAPKQKKGSARFAHGASGDSFVQATQSFTCTNTHLLGDKMENSSFSRLNRPLPPQLGNHSIPFTSWWEIILIFISVPIKGQKGALQKTAWAQVSVVQGPPKPARCCGYCCKSEAKLFIWNVSTWNFRDSTFFPHR